MARRPLLVIDGDSFAHRAYHGLPKTIRRKGDRAGGAIVGFANYLLRLWQEEQPRAVVVGWDTLAEPNWRALEFPDYQGGREYDDDIVEQLDILPEFVAACGFISGKAGRFEADDFLATAAAQEVKAGGTALVASGDRDAFQLASDSVTILQPVKMGEIARIGPAEVRERYMSSPHKSLISSRCAVIHPTRSPAPAASARRRRQACSSATRTSKPCWLTASSKRRPMTCGSIGALPPW